MSSHDPHPDLLPVESPSRPLPADLAPEPAGEASATPVWQRLLVALVRAKWVLLALTVAGTAAGVVASRSVKGVYAVTSTLWIEVTERGTTSQGPIRTGELLQSYAWVELLRSFTILDHTIREMRLYAQTTPAADSAVIRSLELAESYRPGRYRLSVDAAGREYVLATAEGFTIERGAVGSPVGAELGLVWHPTAAELRPGLQVEVEVFNIRDLATDLADQISPQMLDQGQFLRLSMEGADPARAAAVLNALTDRFVEVAAQLKRAKLDELTMVLEEQLRYSEENLRTAEADLEGFRVRTITLPSEQAAPLAAGLQSTEAPVLSSFFNLKIEREQLRSDRQAVERVLAEVPSGNLPIDALAPITAVQGSGALMGALQELNEKRAELRALQQRYTADYPPVRRLVGEISVLEGRTIPRIAGELRQGLLAREELLDQRVGSASRELEQIPPRAIEEARLQRRVQIAGDLHATLRQRYEEARLAAASSIPDVRILDRATPPSRPLSDQRLMVILLGFAGSLGLGVGGVLLRDRFDTRVRYPDEVSREMGLPVLGAIPRIEQGKRGSNTSQVAEAFRELRLGVVHAHGAAGPILLTVTSPESGDGKSFVVSNLAAAFAQSGARTLLIDGDIRRGTLHHVLKTQRVPGLTDYLGGAVGPEQIMQATQVPGFWFVGAGSRRVNGPELLGSSRLPGLIHSLRSSFDVILVDSPPLGAGVDPYMLATITRDLLLVFRTGTSDKNFAGVKLEAMNRLPVRILGAVLNDFVASRLYRYYSYLPGYEATEEAEEGAGTDEETRMLASST